MLKKIPPVRLLVIALSILAVWAILSFGLLLNQIAHVVLLIAGNVSAYLCLKLVAPKYGLRIEHRLITLILVFLLINPTTTWWAFFVVGVITQLVQHFLRNRLGPVFNPAAAGIFGLALLGQLPDWWGIAFAPRFHMIVGQASLPAWCIASIGVYVAWKYKKILIPIAVLGAFAFSSVLIQQRVPWSILVDGTLLFFIAVMATEPKTSPILRNHQLIYGAGIGALVAIMLKINFLEPYIGALLLGNLGWFAFRWWKTGHMFKKALHYKSMPRFFRSVGFAVQGIKIGLTERHLRIHIAFTMLVVLFGFILHVSETEWLILLLCIGFVLTAELVNSAIEKTCTAVVRVAPDAYKDMGAPKDLAAGAVLCSAIISATAGLIIFIPHLLRFVNDYFR